MPFGFSIDPIDPKLFDDLDKLQQKLERIGQTGRSGAPSLRPSGGSRAPGSPYERLSSATSAYDQALGLGPLPYDVQRGHEYRIRTALGQVARAEGVKKPFAPPPLPEPPPILKDPKTFGEKLADALYTSRFGLREDGSLELMPLVGRTLTTLFDKDMIPALTAGAAAVAAFTATVREGGQLLSQKSRAFSSSGLSPGFAGGSGIGGFAGVDMVGLSESFGERLRSGGVGSSFMRSKGIIDLGPYTIDKMSNLTKAIDVLAGIQDKNTRIMVARDLGLMDFLHYADASPGARAVIQAAGAITTPTGYGRDLSRNADTLGLLGGSVIERMKMGLFEHTVGPWADMGMAGLNLKNPGVAANYQLSAMSHLLNPININAAMAIREGLTIMRNNMTKNGGETGDKLVEVNKELIRTMKETNETIKGGQRAGAAVPGGWSHVMFEEGMKNRAADLGNWGPR